MKRTRVALCITSLVFAAALAAGCATAEEHNMTLVPEQEATCTEAGHEQYYSCSDCGKYFADAQGTTEISLDDIAIPALGHDVHEVAATEVSCTQDGHGVYYECSRCGALFSDAAGTTQITEDDIEIEPALGHSMQIVQRTEPTYTEPGNIAHYHCTTCNKNFADSYGDTELTDEEIVIPAIPSVGTVTITISIYEAGQTVAADFTEETVTLTSKNISGGGATGVANGATVTIEGVYVDDYTITAGVYSGEISFEEGTTEYAVTLQNVWASNTSYGNPTTGVVDLSKINAADPVIVMSESSTTTGLASYAEATIHLSSELEASDSVAIMFTVRWLRGISKNELNAHSRFGVKMTDGKGLFVALMGAGAGTNPALQICPLREDGFIHPDSTVGGIFDGWDAAHGDYYNAVSAEATGDGLRVAVTRTGATINMYLYFEGAWMLMGTTTCTEDTPNDIRLVVGGDEWEFSDISYGEIEYNEYLAPTETEYGHNAHYAFGDLYLTSEGAVMTESEVFLAPTALHDSVTLTISARKDANNNNSLNGSIALTHADGTQYSGTVTAGSTTLSGVKNGVYTVVLTAENGDIYDGVLTVTAESDSYALSGSDKETNNRMEYRFVTITSTIAEVGGSYTTDLSAMNNRHHIVNINNINGPMRTNYYTQATFAISDEIANSKYAVLDFWLGFLGANFSAITRFGVMMTDNDGVAVIVDPNDSNAALHMRSYPFYSDDRQASRPDTDIFGGYGTDLGAYATMASNALTGNRLHIQVVRADTDIFMYAEFDGAWVLLGQATCETEDKTQISFLVLNSQWEVYDPAFGVMTHVEEKEPVGNVAGNIEHYTWQIPSNFDYTTSGTVYYFNTDGSRTTLENVTTGTLESVTLTLSGKKEGATAALSGSLTGSFGANSITGNVENGSVTLTNVNIGTYTLTLMDGAGDIYTGTVTFVLGQTEYTLTLEYLFATDTSVGANTVVDLSAMNDANHTVTLTTTGSGQTGVDNYAQVTLNLPDEVANSTSVTLEFTLTATGSFNAYSRFGVMMAEEKGMSASVMGNVTPPLQIFAIDPDDPLGIFNGWDGNHGDYYAVVAQALQGDGLRVRMVRAGATITMYMYLGEEWVEMGSATCTATASTDIRFCVGGNGSNAWTFSDITYSVTGAQN